MGQEAGVAFAPGERGGPEWHTPRDAGNRKCRRDRALVRAQLALDMRDVVCEYVEEALQMWAMGVVSAGLCRKVETLQCSPPRRTRAVGFRYALPSEPLQPIAKITGQLVSIDCRFLL